MILLLATHDLRQHDNPAFDLALRRASALREEVRVAWVRPDGWGMEGIYGIPRFSEGRKRFWESSWSAFAGSCAARGLGVEVMEGGLDLFFERNGVPREVLFSRAFSSNEAVRERVWGESCARRGAAFCAVEGHDLFQEAGLGFPLERFPATFTPFRERVEKSGVVLGESAGIGGDALAGDGAEPRLGEGLQSFPWGGSEREALERLRWYVWESQGLRRYKETRNGLMGSAFSGKFSPWLATGALSVRRIWWETLRHEREYGATDGTVWMRVELLWRSYFLWNARVRGSALFRRDGWNGRGSSGRVGREHDAVAFLRWCEGRTGDGLVDAGMRELVATGFMSNRVRQNAASYLIHELGCDWRAGAAFFESHLLDYEAGSNWGNWAYIAGVGSDPRPVRRFNTGEQAERYDSDGAYRQKWLGNSLA
jgi:deoxyribodipyrimidine photo-lyase